MRIAIVNPTIRQGPCGVWDFTNALSNRLQEKFHCSSIVVPQSIERQSLIGRFPYVWREKKGLFDTLTRLVRSDGNLDAIIVQFSGYGYEESGAPVWLGKEISKFRKQFGNCRIIIYFHELYAVSFPWRRSFWYAPAQKAAVQELVNVTDFAITNCMEHKDRLLNLFGMNEQNMLLCEVPSNIGEPLESEFLTFSQRKSDAIVFGGLGNRENVFRRRKKELNKVIETAGIERILEIGPGQPNDPRKFSVPCEYLGVLPEHEITGLMATARYGLLWYPPNSLGKSSIFAAYQAHGLLTFNFHKQSRTASFNPYYGIFFCDDRDILKRIASFDCIRTSRTYSRRSRESLVEVFGDLLGLPLKQGNKLQNI